MPGCIAPSCSAAREVGALFCAKHLAAPAVQRGGWISAYRRRIVRGGNTEVPLDASNISRRLWVGGKPPFDRDLPEFDVLVLCAQEIQPASLAFHGKVVRVAIPDGPLSDDELARSLAGGKTVAAALDGGKRVLSTCRAGVNRSALVAGLGLGLVTQMSADKIIELMRARRNPECLYNTHFQAILQRYIGSGRRAKTTETGR